MQHWRLQWALMNLYKMGLPLGFAVTSLFSTSPCTQLMPLWAPLESATKIVVSVIFPWEHHFVSMPSTLKWYGYLFPLMSYFGTSTVEIAFKKLNKKKKKEKKNLICTEPSELTIMIHDLANQTLIGSEMLFAHLHKHGKCDLLNQSIWASSCRQFKAAVMGI